MCLAVPGKIIEIMEDERKAKVDFGGIIREINIQLIKNDAKIGTYVLVHAGYAISTVDEQTAKETIEIWKSMGQGTLEEII